MKGQATAEPPTVRVTLSLPDETVAFVRVEAARAGKSMSRWIADQVTGWWEADQAGGKPARRPATHSAPKRNAAAKR